MPGKWKRRFRRLRWWIRDNKGALITLVRVFKRLK